MTKTPGVRPLLGRASLIAIAMVLSAGTVGVGSPAAAAPPDRVAVIVQLQQGSDPDAESRRAAANGGGRVNHVYRDVLRGFSGEFTEQAMDGLRRNPRVSLIEPDGVVTASATQTNPPPPWGLDRIDQRALPLTSSFTYPDAAGLGVTAYIIDTGLSPNTAEFGDRVLPGYSSIGATTNTVDCNGHGTHVSGTVGSASYGVAKKTTIVPVRVLDCSGSGSTSGVIAGLEFAKTNHTSGPAVANMSLGGLPNSSLDTAVKNLIADGVTVVVAAGNSNRAACKYSPSRVGTALTVGATDISDKRASFSNFGTCLDLFAPGVGVLSTWLDGGTNTISGTSMASPHVAGAAAVLLSTSPALSPSAVASTLTSRATLNVVKTPGQGSPNRLLYVAPV